MHMKSPESSQYKPHLLLTWVLLFYSFSFFSAQSIHNDQTSTIDLEDGRQIQSSHAISWFNNPFLLDGAKPVRLDLSPYEKKSLVFSSNQENYSASISFKVALPYKAWESEGESLKWTLTLGLMVKVQYWSETDIAGEVQEIALEEGSWTDYNGTHIFLKFNFQIQGVQKGGYLVEIENRTPYKIELWAAMIMHDSNISFSKIGENFECRPVIFGPNSSQVTYDIFTGRPGKWYLSVYSCGLLLNLTVERLNKNPDLMTLKNGEFLYQENIGNKSREERSRRITITIPEGDDPEGRIELFSAVINEKEFFNYKLEEDPKIITLKKKEDKNRIVKFRDFSYPINLTVKFEPLRFKEFKSNDEINYEVEIFYENPKINCEKGVMTEKPPEPNFSETRVPIDHKETMTAHFIIPYDFSGYIRIKAFVIRDLHKIQYFTYPIRSVKERDPIWKEDMEDVGIIIVKIVYLIFVMVFSVIAVTFCYKGFKKVRARSEKRGEHEAFEGKREGEDESVNDAQVVDS